MHTMWSLCDCDIQNQFWCLPVDVINKHQNAYSVIFVWLWPQNQFWCLSMDVINKHQNAYSVIIVWLGPQFWYLLIDINECQSADRVITVWLWHTESVLMSVNSCY